MDLQGVLTARTNAIAGDSRVSGASLQSWEAVVGNGPLARRRAMRAFVHEAMDRLLVRQALLRLLGRGLGSDLGILLGEALGRCRAIRRLEQWAG